MNWDFERLPNDPRRLEKRREEVNKMYELPYLPGTRVCLNPEANRYRELHRRSGGNAGYVIDPQMHDYDLIRWRSRNHKDRTEIIIKFDNGWKVTTRYNEVLPIDAPNKTVTKYILSNGDRIVIVDGDDTSSLDKTIIKHGVQIREKIVYDNEWRDKIIHHISENMTNQQSNPFDVDEDPVF